MTTMVTDQSTKGKGLLKNEKGLTLIELLAVIVILAIIAAIAIPSIGGIINRTKKESHRANAQIIVDATRYAVTAEGFPMGRTGNEIVSDSNTGSTYIEVPVSELNNKGYLESVPADPESSNKDPYGNGSAVRIHRMNDTGKYRYQVKLVKSNGTNAFAATATDKDGFVWETEIKEAKLNGD